MSIEYGKGKWQREEKGKECLSDWLFFGKTFHSTLKDSLNCAEDSISRGGRDFKVNFGNGD